MAYVSRPPIQENWHPGGFLVSQPNGKRHIDAGTVTGGARVFPGTVMGRQTASGKWVPVTAAATDGSKVAAGICFGIADATLNDVPAAIVVRQCEVNTSELVWDASMDEATRAKALTALLALGIVAR